MKLIENKKGIVGGSGCCESPPILYTIMLLVIGMVVGGVIVSFPSEKFQEESEILEKNYEEVCEEKQLFLIKYNVSVFRIAEDEFRDTYDVFNHSYIEEEEIVKTDLGNGVFFFVRMGNVYSDRIGSYHEKWEILSEELLSKAITCRQVEVKEIEVCEGVTIGTIHANSDLCYFGCIQYKGEFVPYDTLKYLQEEVCE